MLNSLKLFIHCCALKIHCFLCGIMVLEFFRGVLGLTAFVKFPVVRADDDDEEELVDPFVAIRKNCERRENAVALRKVYNECNARVRSKQKTRETCEQEIHDLVKALDHCVSENLFDHVK